MEVKIDNNYSETQFISFSVSLESVGSPLLFLQFIHDLPNDKVIQKWNYLLIIFNYLLYHYQKQKNKTKQKQKWI